MPAIKLEVIITEQGQVTVNGPIQDRVLCFGILEVAKESISEYHRQKSQPRVQAATGLDAMALINGGR